MAVDNPFGKGNPAREIALAILDCDEKDDFASALSDALVDISDPRKLFALMTGTAAAIAYLGDVTPRTVYEQLFAQCPTDSDWQAVVERWREQREERE